MEHTVSISIAAFVIILTLLILLRAINSKYEVRSTDIVVAILPVVIFLLVTGKIHKFEVGELRIETAFVNASTSEIMPQVTQLIGLLSEPISTATKRGVEEIPHLIEKKHKAFCFVWDTVAIMALQFDNILFYWPNSPFCDMSS